jgi:predicted DNA-binding transcriptional regulator AlpA
VTLPEIQEQARRERARRLPEDLARDRIVGTPQAAAFTGYSESHWRVLVRDGLAPPAIKLSARRYAWRISDLRAWIASKEAAA